MNHEESKTEKKKFFTWSTFRSGIFWLLLILIIFVPDFKAGVLSLIYKTGLLQPEMTINDTGNAKQNLGNVSFKNSDGQQVQLSDWKGKVVFLNFWATWCPPCIAEMPSIGALHEKYRDHPDIVFAMVDMDADFKKSLAFMEKRQLELPVYVPATAIPPALFEGSLPTTVILGKDGQIVFRHVGGADYSKAKVFEFIDSLLK